MDRRIAAAAVDWPMPITSSVVAANEFGSERIKRVQSVCATCLVPTGEDGFVGTSLL